MLLTLEVSHRHRTWEKASHPRPVIVLLRENLSLFNLLLPFKVSARIVAQLSLILLLRSRLSRFRLPLGSLNRATDVSQQALRRVDLIAG